MEIEDFDDAEGVNEYDGVDDIVPHDLKGYDFEPRPAKKSCSESGEGGSEDDASSPPVAPPTHPEEIGTVSVAEWDGTDVETEEWRLEHFIWCRCHSNCRPMPEVRECVCCHDLTECEDRGVGDEIFCIVEHPNFHPCILNQDTLHMTMLTAANTSKKNLKPPIENRSYRLQAYKNFTSWLHGGLGKNIRRVIPSCAVWAIRDAYPEESGVYRGFLEADDALPGYFY